MYQIMSSCGLLCLGIYHIFSTTRNHLKSPRDYFAKPYHPLSFFSSNSNSNSSRLRHIPLYLVVLWLLIALIHQIIISSDSDPLLKGRTPVHLFTSLQSAGVLFLFLFLSISLLISESTPLLPLPPDLFFGLASALFYLHYSVSHSSASVQTSDLQAKCDSVSSRISALSSLSCLALSCLPRLFVADVCLGASLCLQGLWALQTGLSLHVDAFIPEGCHKLLDVVSGIEGSTKCDLEDSKLRAIAILDLVFLVHIMFVVIIVMVTYAAIVRTVTITTTSRRFGSYEALPTIIPPAAAPAATADPNHIQMKAMAGTQA